MLSVISDPTLLLRMTIREFVVIMEQARNLPTNRRREINKALVETYHMQSNIRDPMLALEELVLRIVYELMTRKMELRDVLRCRWYACNRRDPNHFERVVRLVECIRTDKMACVTASSCDWLMFYSNTFP